MPVIMTILISNCTIAENFINIRNKESFSEYYEVIFMVVA